MTPRLALLLAALAAPSVAMNTQAGASQDAGDLCLEAIAAAERKAGVPPHLLKAIALAESGRRHETAKTLRPWPWTVTAEGRGRFLATKAEALAVVAALHERKIRNIDVGCLQVNLHYHSGAFATVEEALDPTANADYAARFLHALYRDSGSWANAVARYHASIYARNLQYRSRVMRIWHRLRGGN